LDINIRNLWRVEIGGFEIWITQTVFNTWLIMLFLILGAIILRLCLRKMDEKPRGVQNVAEAIVESFGSFVKSTAGERASFVGAWFFMVFLFILTSNVSGAIGLRPPTADWATTFALAVATLVLIQVAGIYSRGPGYLLDFFKPMPIGLLFFPLNIIGELAKPISLSFRLFGNLLSGLILMTIVYTLTPVFARFILPVPIHAFFDVIMGALQTFIFCALSLAFIGGASSVEE